MRKRNTEKKSLRRQLISGTVYAALAAVVVAVTVNTTVGMISGKSTLPITDSTPQNLASEIPELPELNLPELNIPVPANDFTVPETKTAPVSDTAEGVNDIVTEEITDNSDNVSAESLSLTIPDDAVLGIDRFIKPCDGYVSKEHSSDVPVYSTTLSDYRIHIGVDVTGDIGTPVSCVCGGIVTDIYDDDLYGKTVCIQNRDGYTVKYSNLHPTLNATTKVGAIIATGDTIGGIGDTALCEAVDTPHLHLEIHDSDGNPVDPENLISF